MQLGEEIDFHVQQLHNNISINQVRSDWFFINQSY